MRKDEYLARRMHTPDDPVRAAQRAALRSLSKALLPLHKALIDAAKADYAATGAHISSPSHLFNLLMQDPFFAWLRPITSLIADIDETATRDFDEAQIAALAARIGRFFGNEPDAEFAARYVPLLQRDFDVATGHGVIRQELAKLTS